MTRQKTEPPVLRHLRFNMRGGEGPTSRAVSSSITALYRHAAITTMNGASIFTIEQASFTNLAIVGTACFVCSKIPSELLRCPQCRRISYCSDECQRADSESHEKICLALQRAPASTPPFLRRLMFRRGATPRELERNICLLHDGQLEAFQKTIALEMITLVHSDLLLYEPRCAVCLQSADDMRSLVDPEYTSLLHCQHCRASFACTEAHAAEYYDEHCKELEDGERYTECEMNKRAYEHSLEIVTRGWTLEETLWFPRGRKNEYAPLPSATDTLTAWDQWFADPTNICPPDSSAALNRVRTKQLSIPMTILYGMELFDNAARNSSPDLPLFSSRTELDIAVIGAMEYELHFGGLAFWEEILHSLPSLRRLTLRFVGPRVVFGIIRPDGLNKEAMEWELCDLCKENGIEFRRSFHPVLFHDYAAHPERHTATFNVDANGKLSGGVGLATAFEWPDLAVMFNTGMGTGRQKFDPKWSPTLKTLAKNGVPTLCTSFLDREAEEDEELLKSTHCNIVIERHKNPWRSEVAMKPPFTVKRFFSHNQYIQGFRGIAGGDEPEDDSDSDLPAYSDPLLEERKIVEMLSQLLSRIPS